MKTYDKEKIIRILDGSKDDEKFLSDKVPGSKWQNPRTGDILEIVDLNYSNIKYKLYDKDGNLKMPTVSFPRKMALGKMFKENYTKRIK